MPVLKNQRHERFAQELAKGQSATQAYLAAGYEGTEGAAAVSAHRLLKDAKIAARIAELQGNSAKKAEITTESLMAEAAEIQAFAMKLEQPSAAVAALTAKAKLGGLWVERSENKNENTDAVVGHNPGAGRAWADRVQAASEAEEVHLGTAGRSTSLPH